VYDCPLSSKYNCNCPAKLRVSWGPKQVVMQKANIHIAESHAVDNQKSLKHHQQHNAVAVAVKASQLSTPVKVRRHLKNSSPQKQIDAQRLSSLRRAVHTERTNMTSISFPLCQVQVTGSLGSLTFFCAKACSYAILFDATTTMPMIFTVLPFLACPVHGGSCGAARVQGDCARHQAHFVSAYARTHVPSLGSLTRPRSADPSAHPLSVEVAGTHCTYGRH
jgi:hypothetical protein